MTAARALREGQHARALILTQMHARSDASMRGLQTKWHSQSAMAAAEERERRIAVLQQEVDSLKARLWDSAARIGDLEKCALTQLTSVCM